MKWLSFSPDGSVRGLCLVALLIYRLLHSPSVVAAELSVGYETWPLISWYYPLWLVNVNTGLDCLSHKALYNYMTGGNFHFFRGHWQSPCAAPMPSTRAVQGDCEIVYIADKHQPPMMPCPQNEIILMAGYQDSSFTIDHQGTFLIEVP